MASMPNPERLHWIWNTGRTPILKVLDLHTHNKSPSAIQLQAGFRKNALHRMQTQCGLPQD